MIDFTNEQFEFFIQFLQKQSGYKLTEDKKYLLDSRLSSVLDAHKPQDIDALIKELKKDPGGAMASRVIEAMTINETFFFRDQHPFESFEKDILPQLAEWGKVRPVRIWSAACSTGQEPYSIAMILEENKHEYPHLRYEIIATDINRQVLEKAKAGIFSVREVTRGLPEKYKDKYFVPNGTQWQITEDIRKQVQYKYLNLQDDFTGIGQFDVILLRNVLIYFDYELKEKVLSKIAKTIRKDGYLILGAAEGIHDPKHYFARSQNVKNVYQYKDGLEAGLAISG
ncbi:MAG: protein-glutamate O-methyltransferase CheR [Micavibrio sp.]